MIMSHGKTRRGKNRVQAQRRQRGWSQAELARRAGISRTAVSAMEMSRLVPSVAAALALAKAFDCSVEALFGVETPQPPAAEWAWSPRHKVARYWHAELRG